ncbi:MAG: aminoacyl-tRNA hydrolase [Pseudomonadota bacterium]|nr:aminoacyl-tRNA hydrolase [Pseudomonadota bacterium]
MFLVVGLGNPGSKYENNRHNIGFKAVDDIFHRFSFSAWSQKFNADMAKGSIDQHKVVLLKPMTYMNNSGESVQKAMAYFKIKPENVIVLHDELDLPPLKVRYKLGGGNGGHNGLKSIQQRIGTADFYRFRIGVGHPGSKERVSGYVLSDFSKTEIPYFEDLCGDLSAAFPMILSGKGERVVSDLSIYATKLNV